MEYRDVLLVLHVAGAGVWLGANVMQAVIPPRIARQGVQAAAGWYRVAASFSRMPYIPSALLILVTGILLVLQDDNYHFTSPFVVVGIGMIVIGALLGSLIFDPGSKRAAEAVEAGDGTRVRAVAARLAAWGMVDTLLLLFTITVMVIRWD